MQEIKAILKIIYLNFKFDLIKTTVFQSLLFIVFSIGVVLIFNNFYIYYIVVVIGVVVLLLNTAVLCIVNEKAENTFESLISTAINLKVYYIAHVIFNHILVYVAILANYILLNILIKVFNLEFVMIDINYTYIFILILSSIFVCLNTYYSLISTSSGISTKKSIKANVVFITLFVLFIIFYDYYLIFTILASLLGFLIIMFILKAVTSLTYESIGG